MSNTNTAEQTGKSVEPKTHWRKNLDPRYISGEDLKNSLRGLKPEMVVAIDKMQDAPTFDQSTQKETTKTSLWLIDLATKQRIYKPVILNVSNAKFFTKEFGSEFIEDWYGKPCVLYAQPDKRFGHVARFKHYYAPPPVTDTSALAKLNTSKTLGELQSIWSELSQAEQKLPTVLAFKDMQERQQQKLTPPKYEYNPTPMQRRMIWMEQIDRSEHADANTIIRGFALLLVVAAIFAIMVLYLPGVHFEDIFAGGVK